MNIKISAQMMVNFVAIVNKNNGEKKVIFINKFCYRLFANVKFPVSKSLILKELEFSF